MKTVKTVSKTGGLKKKIKKGKSQNYKKTELFTFSDSARAILTANSLCARQAMRVLRKRCHIPRLYHTTNLKPNRRIS